MLIWSTNLLLVYDSYIALLSKKGLKFTVKTAESNVGIKIAVKLKVIKNFTSTFTEFFTAKTTGNMASSSFYWSKILFS